MKPVFQTRFGNSPDAPGNCFSACVASIFECRLSDLPDEAAIVQEIIREVGFAKWSSWPPRFQLGKSWERLWGATQAWLVRQGLTMLEVTGSCPEMADCWCIISGKSPRLDCLHACVGFGRTVMHDPYPSGGGVGDEDRSTLYFVRIDPAATITPVMTPTSAAA